MKQKESRRSITLSEDKEEIWCPICDEYKVYKCNQPEEVEKRLISEFVKDLDKILWDKIHLVDVMEKWEEKLQ